MLLDVRQSTKKVSRRNFFGNRGFWSRKGLYMLYIRYQTGKRQTKHSRNRNRNRKRNRKLNIFKAPTKARSREPAYSQALSRRLKKVIKNFVRKTGFFL